MNCNDEIIAALGGSVNKTFTNSVISIPASVVTQVTPLIPLIPFADQFGPQRVVFLGTEAIVVAAAGATVN